MTEKDLKKLGRAELLELLIEAVKENDTLREELSRARADAAERSIYVQESGSMAEAALKLNGIFEAADKAAEQYLSNVRGDNNEPEIIRQNAQKEADRIIADAVHRAEEIEREARQKSESYWDELSSRMEEYYYNHPGLKEAFERRRE